MEPDVLAHVDMLIDESEIFIEKINKERAEKLVTIPSSLQEIKIVWEGNAWTKS